MAEVIPTQIVIYKNGNAVQAVAHPHLEPQLHDSQNNDSEGVHPQVRFHTRGDPIGRSTCVHPGLDRIHGPPKRERDARRGDL